MSKNILAQSYTAGDVADLGLHDPYKAHEGVGAIRQNVCHIFTSTGRANDWRVVRLDNVNAQGGQQTEVNIDSLF